MRFIYPPIGYICLIQPGPLSDSQPKKKGGLYALTFKYCSDSVFSKNYLWVLFFPSQMIIENILGKTVTTFNTYFKIYIMMTINCHVIIYYTPGL